ncbi:hypothetical protein [Alphaentomopoxvirus acuprea]|uniref:Uncharacterized protein n=1 Tax=Alphaentomopoxvirus acuprea TaxID=62099 RepID=W6JPK6_9POXV|nr:hypothetical protein BA82_gp084 [Anomala cuprea entomopoxvirus]BAO49444.1 hypothetical protein [Anomala cuprea entomopoxvirus]
MMDIRVCIYSENNEHDFSFHVIEDNIEDCVTYCINCDLNWSRYIHEIRLRRRPGI